MLSSQNTSNSASTGTKPTRDSGRRPHQRHRERKPEPVIPWNPRTRLGSMVQAGSVQSMDDIFQNGWKIKEYEINIPDEKYLSIKLADMSLSVRSINALEHANVVTVRDIVTKTQQELLKTRLLGRRSINEIRLFLSSMNLEFGMVL